MKEKLIKENERFWPIYSREMLIIFNSKTPTKIDSPVLTKSLRSTRENLSSIKRKNKLNLKSYLHCALKRNKWSSNTIATIAYCDG